MRNPWPSREPLLKQIKSGLSGLASRYGLPGISNAVAFDTLALQFVASLRREDYTKHLLNRCIPANRADPHNALFDADKAIVYHLQQGDIDEAAWFIFLATHFGKPAASGWRRLADVYGRLGQGKWTWAIVSAAPDAFELWLAANWQRIGGKFGNHRKYETLRPDSPKGTAAVVRSYIDWIGHSRSHRAHFDKAIRAAGNDPHAIFDNLYRSMRVLRFGRLAKFDYLSLIGRLNIAPIEAGSAYLNEATGPTRGARLLFDGRIDGPSDHKRLQEGFDEIATVLNISMQVIEDAICNWQKSPTNFVHFKG